jgi:uncharacterized protein YjbI with pentapeptide repeats
MGRIPQGISQRQRRAATLALAVAGVGLAAQRSGAQVYRRDNGQLISYTWPGPYADFSGQNLDYANLPYANLLSANLTSTSLYSAYVYSANFTGAIISHCGLLSALGFTIPQLVSTASYQNRDLSGVVIGNYPGAGFGLAADGMDLSGFNLTSMFFADISLTSATFISANLTASGFDGSNVQSANFTDANVRYANLAGAGNFTVDQLKSTAGFKNHDLTGIGLALNLTGFDLSNQNLTAANLVQSHLDSANLTGAIVKGANFANTGLTADQLSSTASYQNHDLGGIGLELMSFTGFDFSSQNLASADFRGGTLASCDFTSANLSGANLSVVNFNSVNFGYSNLVSANLQGTFQGVSFRSADLTSATLWSVSLASADLTGAVIRGVNFQGTGLTMGQLASTASYQARDLSGVTMLYSLNLASADFSGGTLAGGTFASADLTSANLSGANLSSADLEDSQLFSANLMSTNLTQTSFNLANLTYADLRGATPGAISIAYRRGAIMPDGTVAPFTMDPAEIFRIRAGPPVTLTGAVSFVSGTEMRIDSGANVTSAVPFAIPSGASVTIHGGFTVPALTISNGGLLDVTTSAMTINYGTSASPNTAVRNYISNSFHSAGMPWYAYAGITSTDASLDPSRHAVAFADGADGVVTHLPAGISTAIPAGGVLPAGTELVTYALAGDANLDGKVDFNDFLAISTHFLQADINWDHGNFNYDGIIDFNDFVVLATNFGEGVTGGDGTSATPQQLAGYNSLARSLGASSSQIAGWDAAISNLPEPTSFGAVALGAAFLMQRRRGHRTLRNLSIASSGDRGFA